MSDTRPVPDRVNELLLRREDIVLAEENVVLDGSCDMIWKTVQSGYCWQTDILWGWHSARSGFPVLEASVRKHVSFCVWLLAPA